MIFVCVGSREYQFNRLLIEIDKLVEEGKIVETVFAQIGQSTYIPKNYKYERFIDSDKFREYQMKARLIISHGGTGALIGALKLEKQVIAVPRLAIYDEHIDDHQIQVSEEMEKQGYLRSVIDINDLLKVIELSSKYPITKKYNKPSNIIRIITDFIENNNI